MPPKKRKSKGDTTTSPPSKRIRTTRSSTAPKTDKSTLDGRPQRVPDDPPSSSALESVFEEISVSHASLKSSLPCHIYSPAEVPEASSSPLTFTHGAGGTLLAPAVANFCRGYATRGKVVAFQGNMNLTHRIKGFRVVQGHLEEKGKIDREQILLGGRSMGSRAAVMAALEFLHGAKEEGVEEAEVGHRARELDKNVSNAPNEARRIHDSVLVNLILISYPLVGPKKDVRSQILYDLPPTASVLFIIGSGDNMCPLDLLNDVRSKMAAKTRLVVVEDANHGMHIKGKPDSVEKEVGEMTGKLAAEWVTGGEEWKGDEEWNIMWDDKKDQMMVQRSKNRE